MLQLITHNRLYESKSSAVKSIVFDGESDVAAIPNIIVTNRTENTISLGWKYNKIVDGFIVGVEARPPYPYVPPRLTNSNNITVTNLAPGVYYTFKVLSNFQTGDQTILIIYCR